MKSTSILCSAMLVAALLGQPALAESDSGPTYQFRHIVSGLVSPSDGASGRSEGKQPLT